jgi:hypothetical protein
MGNDFLRTQADKHRKAWSTKYAKAADDMHVHVPEVVALQVVARMKNGTSISLGEQLLLVLQNNAVLVCKENIPLAEVKFPPGELLDQLNIHRGMMLCQVAKIHRRANALSVTVLQLE